MNCKCGKVIKKSAEFCRSCYNEVYGIHLKSKGDLIKSRSNWWAARVPIAKHARKVYLKSNKPLECLICKYSLHIEICHIKPVSDFTDDALLREINDVNNLIALCPNHHWEFDNGKLKI